MKKKTASQSGIFNTRVVIAVALCSFGLSLGWFSFAAPALPNKHASARASAVDWRGKVEPGVLAKAAVGPAEFMVYMAPQADLSEATTLATKDEKGRYVYQRLTSVAEATQAPVRSLLAQLGVPYKSFWISNAISTRGDLAVIQAVAALPEVATIQPIGKGVLQLPPQENTSSANRGKAPTSPDAINAVEPGVGKVNADDVWALGYKGQGVVVAGQDTGVRWTHNALKNHYRGWNGTSADHNYNWHDSIHTPTFPPDPTNPCNPGGATGAGQPSPEPCDDNSHGSHTVGTMIGDDGGSNKIGMAPEAKWIACRNMGGGVGIIPSYLECMEWMIAPTKLDGTDPDPSKAPHVINNSWGCVEGCPPEPNNPLRDAMQASRAAGIVYVASAGNDGPACNTIEHAPARYPEAFTVGNTTHTTDLIATTSSRGPTAIDPENPNEPLYLKPNITAPGSAIRSSNNGTDTAYGNKSGTSMSGPHVAGLVALIISANPTLAGNVDRIEDIIEQTAVPKTTTEMCGLDSSTAVPNNTYGHGRIDALAAVNMALADLGCPVPNFVDDLEPAQLPGWTFEVAQNDAVASPTWALMTDPNAHSITHSFSSDSADPSGTKDDRLIAPPQDLSANSHLIFWHQFKFEETFDGGVLEISTDGGNTWVDVLDGGGSFVSGGYNGTIVPDFGSLIADRAAWTGLSAAAPMMNRVEVDLGAFAGNGVLVRWRLVLDEVSIDPGTGWWVDDIEFTNLACPLPPPVPTLVASRKVHSDAGPFDIPLPLAPLDPGIECRNGGVTQVVMVFGQPVTFTGADVTSGTGDVASVSGNGTNQATINLTGVTNQQTISVTLFGVGFAAGGASADIPVSIGVLFGDTNSVAGVTGADVNESKAQVGIDLSSDNFRHDVNTTGFISGSDVNEIKAHVGDSL